MIALFDKAWPMPFASPPLHCTVVRRDLALLLRRAAAVGWGLNDDNVEPDVDEVKDEVKLPPLSRAGPTFPSPSS